MGNLIPRRPRPLGPTDNTEDFDSGEESLNRYLNARALANHVADLARCYVCVDAVTGSILGYYTLSTVAIERGELPGKVRRNSPGPLPAVLLGRLAIDAKAQGSGLSRFLVRDAILSTLAAAERVGVRVLLVHALNEQAAAFHEGLGLSRSLTHPLHL